MALDPEHRLVVGLVVGKRTEDATHELVSDFHRRTAGRVMRLMTSDEYPVYESAIRDIAWSDHRDPAPDRSPGASPEPAHGGPTGGHIRDGPQGEGEQPGGAGEYPRGVRDGRAVVAALVASAVSNVVNTCFVERHNGTDRNRCSRKVRKTYAFSKDWDVHRAATVFSYFSYNFCWPVRTLRERGADGRWRARTPAMAAGLTDHVWSLAEWLTFPAVQRK